MSNNTPFGPQGSNQPQGDNGEGFGRYPNQGQSGSRSDQPSFQQGNQPWNNGAQPQYGTGPQQYGNAPQQFGNGPQQFGPGAQPPRPPQAPQFASSNGQFGAQAGRPGPNQPNAQFSQYGAQQPPQNFGPDSGQSGKQSGSKKTLAIVLGGVALLLIVALIVFFANRAGSGGKTGPKSPASSSTGIQYKGDAKDSVATVSTYFDALTSGDAAKLLTTAKEAPANAKLITDEVLKASQTAAPITDITVDEANTTKYSVVVNYKMGGTPQTAKFSMSDVNGQQKISRAWADVNFYGSGLESGDLTLNGQQLPPEGNDIEMPIGTYALAAVSPIIKVEPATVTIAEPEYTSVDIAATITEDGKAKLQQAVKAAADACFASGALDNKACGWTFNSQSIEGSAVAPDSLKCSAPADLDAKIAGSEPKLGYSGITGALQTSIDCKATSVSGEPLESTTSWYEWTADISDPNVIKITFE